MAATKAISFSLSAFLYNVRSNSVQILNAMWKRGSKNEVLQLVEGKVRSDQVSQNQTDHQQHPYAFHVSGPRNVPSLNWKDLIISTWKNSNYKRTVMACFIQAVYLLELTRKPIQRSLPCS